METKTNEVNQRHHRNTQDRLRLIIASIASFLLSLSLVGLTVLLVIQWSGFSRSSFYKNMSANEYYDHVMSDIYNEAESLTLPIGLPITVLGNVITSYGISRDVNGYIDASFEGVTYVADTQEVEDKLEQNVRAYLTEAGIIPDAEQESNLKAYIDSIIIVYTNTVQMPLLSSFVKARNVYNKFFGISIIGCIAFALVCLFVILRLHQWLHRGLRYVAYATLATGLMIDIVQAIILQSGFYKKIHLSPEYFYNFFTDYVTNIFKSFLNFSIIWLVVSALLIAVIGALKKSRGYYKRDK